MRVFSLPLKSWGYKLCWHWKWKGKELISDFLLGDKAHFTCNRKKKTTRDNSTLNCLWKLVHTFCFYSNRKSTYNRESDTCFQFFNYFPGTNYQIDLKLDCRYQGFFSQLVRFKDCQDEVFSQNTPFENVRLILIFTDGNKTTRK